MLNKSHKAGLQSKRILQQNFWVLIGISKIPACKGFSLQWSLQILAVRATWWKALPPPSCCSSLSDCSPHGVPPAEKSCQVVKCPRRSLTKMNGVSTWDLQSCKYQLICRTTQKAFQMVTSNTFSQCLWVISPRLEVFSMDIHLGLSLLVLLASSWLKRQRPNWRKQVASPSLDQSSSFPYWATDNIWCLGLAYLNLVSVLSFSKVWYHRPRYRFLVSVLLFFEENAQITKPMSNRRLLSTTQIKSVAQICN